eukprot:TRINITY_DN877_c0_g1_i23.p1 TRINITY_DN877_c0_g1~~TRINITY_DN877_c0_g1_i23.p1  ORF type:complete len:188 (-),score=29.95 TRINITY_DN877_c0_g1_i23:319-882(-)
MLSKTFGGGLGFLLGRSLFKEWVERKVEGVPSLSRVSDSVQSDGLSFLDGSKAALTKPHTGWKFAVMLRLSPMPSWVCTYGLSITRINFLEFLFATLIGSLPMVFQNVWVGSMVQNFALETDLEAEGFPKSLFMAFMATSTVLTLRYLGKYISVGQTPSSTTTEQIDPICLEGCKSSETSSRLSSQN